MMMFVVKKYAFVFILTYVPLVINQQDDSAMQSSLRFATKNPYLFKEPQILSNSDFRPRKVWAIYRHGTRFPGKKTISKYFGLVGHIDSLQNSSHLTNEEKTSLKNWKPLAIDLVHQKFLTKEGEEELFLLGTRFKDNFLHYFDLKKAEFTFKHTPTQRTNVSARKFIAGLFQNTESSHEPLEVSRDDPILRPYKGCPIWRKNVKKNPASLVEKFALIESVHVENLVNEMREITQIRDLNFKDVELMYTMCGFETAWRHLLHNGKSIWCALFKNHRHIEIMEYLEDLEYYWIDGPGFEITRKVACKTVNDLINQLDPSKAGHQSLSFYFTHSGTILKLLSFLELYKDDVHLTADKVNYQQRLWRTSIIDTFSSNIIAILYDSTKYGPHVQLLHQENIVQIPKCNSNEFGMCSYDDFRNIYEEKIKDCNLSALCNVKDEL